MKLTTKSEYSLLALIYIARHEANGFVKVEDICAAYDMPKKYIEQLLRLLKQTGYVRARRGASGGYQLMRPASKITLASVIRTMDGALAPTESVSKYFFAHTPLEQEKAVIGLFKDIRDYVAKRLERTTIKDLL